MKKSLDERIREIVAVTIGQASMCWDNVEKAGCFDTTRAGDLAENASAEIENVIYEDKKEREAKAEVGATDEH